MGKWVLSMKCWFLADKRSGDFLNTLQGSETCCKTRGLKSSFLKSDKITCTFYNIQLPRNLPDGLLGPSSKMLATLLMKSGILALKALLGGPGGCVDNSRRVPGVLQLRPELSNPSPVDSKQLRDLYDAYCVNLCLQNPETGAPGF